MFANLQRKNYHRNQCLMGISPARSLSLPKVSEEDTSPTYAFKAYLLCEISILIYGGIWLFLGHEVVQFLVRFPVHGVFERCCVAGYAESFEQRRFDRAE